MDDPIVNEIRKSREILLKKHGGNLKKYLEFLRREEEKKNSRTVRSVQKKNIYGN